MPPCAAISKSARGRCADGVVSWDAAQNSFVVLPSPARRGYCRTGRKHQRPSASTNTGASKIGNSPESGGGGEIGEAGRTTWRRVRDARFGACVLVAARVNPLSQSRPWEYESNG